MVKRSAALAPGANYMHCDSFPERQKEEEENNEKEI